MKVEDSNIPQLYFSAPAIFLGNKRSSYMYHLSFDVTQRSDDFPRNRTHGAGGDVIVKGKSQSFKLVAVVELEPLVYQKFRSYKVFFCV
ncbi:MAG: laminin B domain-containing protein [Cyanobacteria bacterium J06649_11]